MNYFKKILILFMIFIGFQTTCYSSPSLKELESPIETIKLYIYKNSIYKDTPNVIYTIRINDKEMGDYINIVETNCNDMSAGLIKTFEFNKKYNPVYNMSLSDVVLEPVKPGTVLYIAGTYACTSNDSYSKTKTKKTKNSGEDGICMKILKGTGKTIGFILILPFVILGALAGGM